MLKMKKRWVRETERKMKRSNYQSHCARIGEKGGEVERKAVSRKFVGRQKSESW